MPLKTQNWCLILDPEIEAKTIAAVALSGKINTIESPSGTLVYHSADHPSPMILSASDDPTHTRQAINWVQKTYHCYNFICAGYFEAPESAPNKERIPQLQIPHLCLRSAGRLDIGSSAPVLYEELRFNNEMQETLIQAFADYPKDGEGRVFGSYRKLNGTSEADWLWQNLSCMSWDTYSGEVVLCANRWGLKVGCFKVNRDQKKFEEFIPLLF